MFIDKPMGTWYETADETERQEFRDWLRGVLRMHDTTIHFKKKDGTIREMKCTLQESKTILYEKKTDRVKAVSEDTCPVFDIEKQEWRSFRFDSVTQINFDL